MQHCTGANIPNREYLKDLGYFLNESKYSIVLFYFLLPSFPDTVTDSSFHAVVSTKIFCHNMCMYKVSVCRLISTCINRVVKMEHKLQLGKHSMFI